jgi:hypothetical protein
MRGPGTHIPRTLSARAWIEICEAARLIPDADARAEMSAILFVEYPGMNFDRAHVRDMHDRALKIGKQAAKLAMLIRAQMNKRRRVPAAEDDALWRNLCCVNVVLRSTRLHVLGYRAIRRAYRGRKDARQEWLVSQLCGIWLDHFHAPGLTYSVPSRGGPPHGPLIAFLQAAMRRVLHVTPNAETLRDAIDRERVERENARQLRFELERRKAIGD